MTRKEPWQAQVTTPAPIKTNNQLVLVKKAPWQARVQAMAGNENSEQQCWRCRCTLQPGQIRRRLVNTAASRGTHILTGDTVIPEEYFELVSLCDDCTTLFARQQRERLLARDRRDAWWGRLLLASGFVAMLVFGRQPAVLAVPLAWLLDRFRVLGPIVLLMGLVFLAEYLLGLRPHRLRGRIVAPWAVIIALGFLWGVWKADGPRWPFGWLARKQKPTAVTPEETPLPTSHPLLKPLRERDDAKAS